MATQRSWHAAAGRSVALAFIAALSLAGLTSDVAFGRQGCVTGFNPPALSVPVTGGPVFFDVVTSSSTCGWNFGRFELPGGTILHGASALAGLSVTVRSQWASNSSTRCLGEP